MFDPTNEDRADRARKAIETYADGEYGFGPRSRFPKDFGTAAQDLISDLLHTFDWNDPDCPNDSPQHVLDRALANYEAEVEEERA